MPRENPWAGEPDDVIPAGWASILGATLWAVLAWATSRWAIPASPYCSGEGLGVVKAVYWLGAIILLYALIRAILAWRRPDHRLSVVYLCAVAIVIVGLVAAHRTITAGAMSGMCGV